MEVQYYLVKRLALLEENARYLSERSNLPKRNPTFVGREIDLVSLEETMDQGKPLVLAAEVGLGGIGKTQIALQYAYRAASKFQLVWWINCEDEAAKLTSYASLAKRLFPQEGKIAENVLIHKVNLYLQEHSGWLLIFDDVENADVIRDCIPKSGGHVLITSRSTAWEGLAQVFKVGVFKTSESVDLLIKITGLFGQEKDAADLGVTLENLPLAVAQAAYYIKETKISIAEYIEKFKLKRAVLWALENPPEDLYKQTVSVTWMITLDKIQEKEALFRSQWSIEKSFVLPLMLACSVLGPRDIPRKLVLENWITHALKMGSFQLNYALTELASYSMIDLTEQSVNIHSLVQTVVRDFLTRTEFRKVVSEMVYVFHDYKPEGRSPIFRYYDSNPDTVNRLYQLGTHGLSIASHAESAGLKNEAAKLMLEIGPLYCNQGNLHLAESVLKRCLAIQESDGAYKNLGNVYVNLGKLEKARECYEKMKCNDRDGAILILIQQGKFDVAERMLIHEIERLRIALIVQLRAAARVEAEVDVRYFLAFSLKHLGFVRLNIINRVQEAIHPLQEARVMFDAIYSPLNTYSAEADYITAQAYEQLGDIENQERYLQSALLSYISIIVEDQPETIHYRAIYCLEKLGKIAIIWDRPLLAKEMFARAAELRKIKHGQ